MTTNKQKGAVSIQHLLGEQNNLFSAVRKHTSVLQIFEKKLKKTLPPPLRDHFILANIDNDTLTLHTDSSAWAAKLRFNTPDILNCIRDLRDVDSPQTIRIKVVPPTLQPIKQVRTLNISNENVQLIQDTADSITDPVLREALLRLSRRKS